MLFLGPEMAVPQMPSDPLAAIRQRFVATIGGHLQEIALLRRSAAGADERREALRSIGLIAHRVAGVAATLGFEDLGRIAAALDQNIGSAMKAKGPELPPDLPEFDQTVDLFLIALHKAQASNTPSKISP